MNNVIVKICKKHGDLTQDQVRLKSKNKIGNPYYQCLFCKRENSARFNENNKEKIKETQAKYHQKRKASPGFKEKKKVWQAAYHKRKLQDPVRREQLLEKWKKWRKAARERDPEKVNAYYRNMSAELHPSYVRFYLKRHYGFENPSDELIKTKSAIMLLKREIMTINFNQGKNKYVKKTRKYPGNRQSKDAERRILAREEEDNKKL